MTPTIEWTSIILAIIGMVSGWVTWWLDRCPHRDHCPVYDGLRQQAKSVD